MACKGVQDTGKHSLIFLPASLHSADMHAHAEWYKPSTPDKLT